MDYAKAQKGVKQAAIVAFVSAAMTFALVLSALLLDAKGRLEAWNDPLNFFDAALIAGLGFAVLRYSRTAALVLFLYFLISKVVSAPGLDHTHQLLGWVFLYFFWKGIRGSFAYHALRGQEDPGYRSAPLWSYLGIALAAVLLILLVFGTSSERDVLPTTVIAAGEDLAPDDRSWLVESGIVEPGERIEVYHSAGPLTNHEIGSLLTDKRVVGYEIWESEIQVSGRAFDDIDSIKVVQKGDFLDETVVAVYGSGGEAFSLWLSTENNGHASFITRLRRRLAAD